MKYAGSIQGIIVNYINYTFIDTKHYQV